MKTIIYFLLIVMVGSAYADGPTYNFNFYNDDSVQKGEVLTPVSSQTVTAIAKEDKKYFEARYNWMSYQIKTKAGGELYFSGSQLSFLIPLTSTFSLSLDYGKMTMEDDYMWDYGDANDMIYDDIPTHVFSVGIEKEFNHVENISSILRASFLYMKGEGEKKDDSYVDQPDVFKFKATGLIAEYGPKFSIGKVNFGLTINSAMYRIDGETTKASFGGKLFAGIRF